MSAEPGRLFLQVVLQNYKGPERRLSAYADQREWSEGTATRMMMAPAPN
jgi:hypothetical protein